ncbi:hypothetical protein TSOC_014820, partial [Tetrabaena socialis]
DKFSQVNEFLKLLGHTGPVRQLVRRQQRDVLQAEGLGTEEEPLFASEAPDSGTQADSSSSSGGSSSSGRGAPEAPPRPLHILDCGCGSSHLSFGTYHYLNHVLDVPATLGGVDVNRQLMDRSNDHAAALGLGGSVRFETAPIGDYSPSVRPDIVLALHACDTATDDALALAVKQ